MHGTVSPPHLDIMETQKFCSQTWESWGLQLIPSGPPLRRPTTEIASWMAEREYLLDCQGKLKLSLYHNLNQKPRHGAGFTPRVEKG